MNNNSDNESISIAGIVQNLAHQKLLMDSLVGKGCTSLELEEEDLNIMSEILAKVIALEKSNANTEISISLPDGKKVDVNINAVFYIVRFLNGAMDILEQHDTNNTKIFELRSKILMTLNDISTTRLLANRETYVIPDTQSSSDFLQSLFGSIINKDED